MKIALKVDADTFRGTREGVPHLASLLKKRNAGATFLFSLGPDHTGRALARVFRPGFLSKVSRTSVVEHYGLKTLMYGTLLPGPDIGRKCAAEMRAIRDAGFEVGVHTWDHVLWQDHVAAADAAWTRKQMSRACGRFEEIFGERPRVHGAAGWQMNAHAYQLEDALGFEVCSDTRGDMPFLPVSDGTPIAAAQLPTTLPTFDELIGLDGVTGDDVDQRVLQITQDKELPGHVFTLHAELEGMKLAPAFERLLDGWLARGHELVSLGDYFHSLPAGLPRHEVGMASIPGRSGVLAVQGHRVATTAG